jgi:hypothetical protein
MGVNSMFFVLFRCIFYSNYLKKCYTFCILMRTSEIFMISATEMNFYDFCDLQILKNMSKTSQSEGRLKGSLECKWPLKPLKLWFFATGQSNRANSCTTKGLKRLQRLLNFEWLLIMQESSGLGKNAGLR